MISDVPPREMFIPSFVTRPVIIVNNGGAEPNEIVELAHFVMNKVQERFGISIQHEVVVYDKNGESSL